MWRMLLLVLEQANDDDERRRRETVYAKDNVMEINSASGQIAEHKRFVRINMPAGWVSVMYKKWVPHPNGTDGRNLCSSYIVEKSVAAGLMCSV